MHSDSDSISAPLTPSLTPQSSETLIQTAEQYCAQAKWSEAIALCQQAIQDQPDWAVAYITLGNAQQGQGQIKSAMESYQQALNLNPQLAQAWVNLGSMFYKQQELSQAIAHYRQAIVLNPNLTAAYWNLALALKHQGLISEATAVEQQAQTLQAQALQVSQGDPITLLHQGNHLAAQGKLEDALTHWQHAISLKPDFVPAYCQIGMILRHQGKTSQALPWFEKALELQPGFVLAHQHRCGILRDAGDFAAARKAVNQYAIACEAQDPIMTAIYLISTYQVSGLNQIAQERFLELEAALDPGMTQATPVELNPVELKALYANLLFSLPYLRDNLEQNYRLQHRIASLYRHQMLESNSPQSIAGYKPKSGKTPLKIGILSNHFNRHSVGWCSADIIRELAHQGAEIYLYCTDRLNRDDRTAIFEQVAQKFYLPAHYPNGLVNSAEIVQAIRTDQLDILLDLDSLSLPVNTEILCQRPAPVCISWLGFDAPQVSSHNYFLCDWHTHPPGQDQYYTEKLVRMPDTFVAVSGFAQQSEGMTDLRKAHRIDSDQVVYLCVAPGRKFSRELAQAQVAILQHVPNSILIHKAFGDRNVFQSTYEEFCEAARVSRHRIKFLDRFPTEEEHRKIYGMADIVLDSYPYNGGTHSLEALWFNVPLVTLKGHQFLSRMGYSFLKGVGVEFGVAESWEEYIDYGIRLGQDSELRHTIENQLKQAKDPTRLAPLWNPARFAQSLYPILEKLLMQ
ncbi:MAG: tetratricopeptide repeat protein [Microcoleaceae cyanobacterium]